MTTPGTAAFTITGNLTETGSLAAAQLTGSTTGTASLTGNNQIASLGNFTASNFALNDATDLLIAGAVTTPGTAAFTITGNLTETGSLTAAQLTGSTTGRHDADGQQPDRIAGQLHRQQLCAEQRDRPADRRRTERPEHQHSGARQPDLAR